MSHRIIGTTGVSTIDELNDITISSAASLQILQNNGSGQWVNRAVEAAEASSTANSGAANDTVIGANTRRYAFITLPSTATYYRITGMECSNGTVVNGNFHALVEMVDASPPVAVSTIVVATPQFAAQTGASSVQRLSVISSQLIPGGTLLGCSIATASATGRYLTATVASANNSKAVAPAGDVPLRDGTAWAATTEAPYFKLYYRPVLGL